MTTDMGQQQIIRPRNLSSVITPRPELTDQAGHVGFVRKIGIGGSLSAPPSHTTATWAPEFLARHPGVKLELNVTDRNVDVIREGYDLAVRMGPLRDTELISRKLADLHWILVASPDYLESRGRPETIDDLRMTVSDFLADGRLVEVLPPPAMPALPAYALHAFGRQLPIRGRLFINFMIEKLSALDL